MEEIATRINVKVVLDHLVHERQLITNAAMERINQKETPLEQCRYLLLHLTRSLSKSPYLDFRDALEACGYLDVVQAIDSEVPVVYECLTSSK